MPPASLLQYLSKYILSVPSSAVRLRAGRPYFLVEEGVELAEPESVVTTRCSLRFYTLVANPPPHSRDGYAEVLAGLFNRYPGLRNIFFHISNSVLRLLIARVRRRVFRNRSPKILASTFSGRGRHVAPSLLQDSSNYMGESSGRLHKNRPAAYAASLLFQVISFSVDFSRCLVFLPREPISLPCIERRKILSFNQCGSFMRVL